MDSEPSSFSAANNRTEARKRSEGGDSSSEKPVKTGAANSGLDSTKLSCQDIAKQSSDKIAYIIECRSEEESLSDDSDESDSKDKLVTARAKNKPRGLLRKRKPVKNFCNYCDQSFLSKYVRDKHQKVEHLQRDNYERNNSKVPIEKKNPNLNSFQMLPIQNALNNPQRDKHTIENILGGKTEEELGCSSSEEKLAIDKRSWNFGDASNICRRLGSSSSAITNNDKSSEDQEDQDLHYGREKLQETNNETKTDSTLFTFETLIANPDKPVMFSGIDVKIQSITPKMIKLRMCPQEDYEDFTEALQRDEGLSPASPIIQIEDFEDFFSNSCKEIWIRHNIFHWEKQKKCHLRYYSNLRNLLSYIDIEGDMFEDYIKVCGHTSDNKEKETKEDVSASGSNTQGQRNERSDSNSNDEGYGQHDESPKATTCYLVHVAKQEEICDIRLYFSRETQENRCPEAHKTCVHAVLDKKAKIAEFLEKELPECGREQAAERIFPTACSIKREGS